MTEELDIGQTIWQGIVQSFTYDSKAPLIFSSGLFWFFFGAVVIVVHLVRNKIVTRNVFLLGFSLFFYYKSSGLYFVLLILSTIIDYYLGHALHRSTSNSKRKLLMTLSLVANLGMLSYYKYAGFLTTTVNDLFGTKFIVTDFVALWSNNLAGGSFDIDSIFLPVGISFFTFQTLSYSLDIYRRKIEPVKNILDFAFFVSFFPQLVAGPIVRASQFIPQIYEKFKVTVEEYKWALFLILNGLIKKILISDYISVNLVDRVFEAPANYTGIENLLAAYGYTIQIYCDFSGYSDIAIGVALLIGFRLPDNFNSPYTAWNITDFWRKWHISLSSWLKDYLYISLGGNRKGKIMTYVNLMITMLLGGLWHGAHIKFIIWGGLHGAGLAVNKMWSTFVDKSKETPTVLKALYWLLTFHFVIFCWIYFRAANMEVVHSMLAQIFTAFGDGSIIAAVLVVNKKIVLLIVLGFVIHWLPAEMKQSVRNAFYKLPDVGIAVVFFLVITLLYQVKTAELQPFIYFQF